MDLGMAARVARMLKMAVLLVALEKICYYFSLPFGG